MKSLDVAVVGAGIVGLAQAYVLAREGRKVTVFERGPAASGASVRNFGMIWPIGQPPGELYQTALRSREIWVELLEAMGAPYHATGSLHATYREDEAAVGQEFCERAPGLGYECSWLDARQTLEKSEALNPDGLLGAIWSPVELTVDARLIVPAIAHFLAERYGVQFQFGAAVQAIEGARLRAGGEDWQAREVVVCSGHDFETLFPDVLREQGLTRCKLQMMRTKAQPAGWKLGPALAFGLTFRHYPTFKVCTSLERLKERVAKEQPEFDRWGIHVLVSETSAREITLGDSHEYGLAVDPFDKRVINQAILSYAKQHLRVPSLDIAEEWHGVYAKHKEKPYLILEPQPGVKVVVVTSGIGMTMSFGIAEQTARGMGGKQ